MPDLKTGIGFYKGGVDRDLIQNKVKAAMEGGNLGRRLQILTAKNNERWIRVIGEVDLMMVKRNISNLSPRTFLVVYHDVGDA